MHSEAAFAALACVSPVQASSGNTVRHRLNRALHIATVNKMIHDPVTRVYIERRLADGKTTREIRRCLKRYFAATSIEPSTHSTKGQPKRSIDTHRRIVWILDLIELVVGDWLRSEVSKHLKKTRQQRLPGRWA